MVDLWLAAIVFVASHFGLSATPLRGLLVRAMGERPYQGLYSLVALVAVAWLCIAYNQAPPDPVLWWLGEAGPLLTIVVLPVSLLLLVLGLGQPNPTSVGAEHLLEDGERDLAYGVFRITRHPVMWAIGLWALSHLVANGELRSVVFFATFAALALCGTALIDAKKRRSAPHAYERFAAATSNLPFAAIVTGRQSLGPAIREMGWTLPAVAVVLYGTLLHLHIWMFGVSPYPL